MECNLKYNAASLAEHSAQVCNDIPQLLFIIMDNCHCKKKSSVNQKAVHWLPKQFGWAGTVTPNTQDKFFLLQGIALNANCNVV